MKKFIYLLSITLLFSLPALAQNEGISFQGLARNAAGEVLVSQQISLRLSILLGSEAGTVAYVETRQTITNPQGIFSVVVGDGTANSKTGNFSTIDWGTASKFIKVEMDPNAGLNFTNMGTSKLQPVPFAFYAYGVDAENVEGIVPVGSGGTGVASIAELKTSLGVDQVNNTSDASKPISTATNTALATKVDKVSGKELSTNDYSTAEKTKLAAITGTNTGDQDLSTYATTSQLASKANAADVTAGLATKVDKEIGKGLSSNDYTTAEKTKLASITGINLQGLQGLPGATGATGPAGPQGLQGPAGPTGNDGAVGPQGATGPAGLPGAAGVAGPAGPRGLPGSTGAAGAQGQPGVAGPAGNDGATGPQGATGPAGTNGVSASSASFVDLTTSQTIAGAKTFSSDITVKGIKIGTGLVAGSTSNNTGVGRYSLLRTWGDGNTGIGASALSGNEGGIGNTAIGHEAMSDNRSGYYNTAIGYYSNVDRHDLTNATAIGVGAIVTASNTIQLGSSGGGGPTPAVTNVKTSGTLTAGTVTYPNTHGSSNQVLSTTGSGTLAWTTPAAGLPSSGNTRGDMLYWNGSAWVKVAAGANGQTLTFYNGGPVWTGSISYANTVVSTTGKIWMDRNLGASQVATSSTDAAAYGDLYQWGRGTDGHQIRTSATTATLSSSDVPGNANFILATISPYDWRSGQNVNLWQGVAGVNNPCPTGYRIPTDAEWEAELVSWGTNSNEAGAFASPLKLPLAGNRYRINGSLDDVGLRGFYWSSTVSGTNSLNLRFSNSSASSSSSYQRAFAFSVRCLKD